RVSRHPSPGLLRHLWELPRLAAPLTRASASPLGASASRGTPHQGFCVTFGSFRVSRHPSPGLLRHLWELPRLAAPLTRASASPLGASASFSVSGITDRRTTRSVNFA